MSTQKSSSVIIQLADYRETCRRSEPSPMVEAAETLWRAHLQTWAWVGMALGTVSLQAGLITLEVANGLAAQTATRRE